jgi:hypothetical protein
MQEQIVMLVGGPDSGKTNYLGRLWLAIREGVGQIVADHTPNDLQYLNQIADYLLQGRFAPHTSHESRNKVTIPIKILNESAALRSNLIVPDVSGEEWMGIYRRRSWSEEWEKDTSGVVNCLIFVRAESDQVVPAIDWDTWAGLLTKAQQSNPEIPTQVILVDWLQCLRSVFVEKMADYRPRIGVIVAAYDLLPNDQKELGPEAYLKTNFPLFWQYISATRDQVDIRVFGTSIADGDFDADSDFRQQFLESKPTDKGYVIYHGRQGVQISKDIGLPILWAMGAVSVA